MYTDGGLPLSPGYTTQEFPWMSEASCVTYACCFLLCIIIHNTVYFYINLLPYDCNFWDFRCDSKISVLKNQTLSCFQWENALCSFCWLFTMLESPQLYLEELLSDLISRLLLSDWCQCRCVDGLMWMEPGCERFSNTTQKWYIIWNSLSISIVFYWILSTCD